MRRFAEHCSLRDVSVGTQRSYYRHVRLLADWLDRDPARAGEAKVRGYILHLKEERGWAPSTVRQAVAACRKYHCDMLGKDWKLWDVVQVRDRKRLPVVLDMDEVASVLDAVALLRHRVPLQLIYCCGLRLDECVRLTVDDIEPGAVTVRGGKGGKDRRIPLPLAMYRKLQRYWLRHRNPKWLFPSPGRGAGDAAARMGRSDEPMGKGALQKAFHDAVVASGIRKKATIHTLRHSYATHLLTLGVNIRQLQLYLGHEDIETTTIYLHLIPFGEEKSMEHVEAIARMVL